MAQMVEVLIKTFTKKNSSGRPSTIISACGS